MTDATSSQSSFFFFGGLSIHLAIAILAHLFSYNISWSATKKEVERSNFFKEVPKIIKRFWAALLIAFILIGGMVVLSTTLVPIEWRVGSSGWAVIFPLAVTSGCHILFPVSPFCVRSLRAVKLIDVLDRAEPIPYGVLILILSLVLTQLRHLAKLFTQNNTARAHKYTIDNVDIQFFVVSLPAFIVCSAVVPALPCRLCSYPLLRMSPYVIHSLDTTFLFYLCAAI